MDAIFELICWTDILVVAGLTLPMLLLLLIGVAAMAMVGSMIE